MKLIRIFRHIACEGPGYLGDIFDRLQLPYEVVCIDAGHTVPMQVDDVSALVFMGGAMSVNDDETWLKDEIALIQRAHKEDVPMLGICLGSQLLSKALGAVVSKGSNGQEIGWHSLRRLAAADEIDGLHNLPSQPMAFHWHGDTFSLPEAAKLILSSDCYPHQAYICGKTLAMQFHIEVTAEMVRDWTNLYAADLAQGGDCNQTQAEICRDVEHRVLELHELADSLIEYWLTGLNG